MHPRLSQFVRPGDMGRDWCNLLTRAVPLIFQHCEKMIHVLGGGLDYLFRCSEGTREGMLLNGI